MSHKPVIGIIGGGNMGAAILGGLAPNYIVSIAELDNKKALKLRRKHAVKTQTIELVAKESEVIILAVKPQHMDGVLQKLKPFAYKEKIFISVAAGITCRYIEKHLGTAAKVIRCMPNLAAQVGLGVSGLCCGKKATRNDLVLATQLFNCVGKTIVVPENLMDSITALTGSGPAYLFYFVECMQKAAKGVGIKDNMAKDLIVHMLKGSIELLESQKEGPDVLRKQVTSKGGTTEAAIKVLMQGKLDKLCVNAVKAAKQKAKTLSK